MTNLLLERYLDQVGAKLKVLSEAEREPQIAEIRQHLETLIAGRIAQGESEVSATKTAISQFDAENRLGADLRWTGLRGRLGQMPDFAVAVLSCFAVSALLLPIFRLIRKPVVLGLASLQINSSSTPRQNLEISSSLFSSPVFWIGLLCAVVLIVGLGRQRLFHRLRSQPVVQEALLWSVLVGAGQFLFYCWMLSRHHEKHSDWESIVYIVLPTAFALICPVRTRAGVGIAAAMVLPVVSIVLSYVILLPSIIAAGSAIWKTVGLSSLLSLLVVCAPLLLITGFRFRLRLEPGAQGIGSTKIICGLR